MRQYCRDLPVKLKLVAIFLAVILANLCASLFYQREDRIYIEYYKAENILGYLGGYINQYLNVILEEDSKEYTVLENHAASMETMTRVFLMCSVAVSLLAALNLSDSVAGPLRELAKYSREISGGNFDIQDVAVRSRDEVGELAAAFNCDNIPS